jgi:hypothetical protein
VKLESEVDLSFILLEENRACAIQGKCYGIHKEFHKFLDESEQVQWT